MKRLTTLLVLGFLVIACQETSTDPVVPDFAVNGCEAGPPEGRGGGRPDVPGGPPDVGCQYAAINVDWVLLSNDVLPGPRFVAGFAFDESVKSVVLFGGVTAENQLLGDTWTYDRDGWSLLSDAASPPINATMAMSYDPERNLVVMFGGSISGETWEYSDGTWTQVLPADHPATRSHARMDFDRKRGVMVLYGGFNQSTGQITADVWEYDGSNWNEVSAAAPPGTRSNHTFVYDRRRDVFILHGGIDNGRNALDDTWEYDGSREEGLRWTPVDAAMPLLRWDHAAAWNQTLGGVVVQGGVGAAGSPMDDTWVLREGDWDEVVTNTRPPARREHALVWDTHLNRALLFGGMNKIVGVPLPPDGDFGDLWELRRVPRY